MFMSHVSPESCFETVPLVKIAPGTSARVTIQSEVAEVIRTHWFGRQYVCPGVDCPACECYQSRLTVFILVTVFSGKVWVPGLLELTPAALSRLRFMLEWEAGSVVPGVVVLVSRRSLRSGVVAEPLDQVGGELLGSLSSSEVLFNSVCRLLGMPSIRKGESDDQWQERVRPFLNARLAKVIAEKG